MKIRREREREGGREESCDFLLGMKAKRNVLTVRRTFFQKRREEKFRERERTFLGLFGFPLDGGWTFSSWCTYLIFSPPFFIFSLFYIFFYSISFISLFLSLSEENFTPWFLSLALSPCHVVAFSLHIILCNCSGIYGRHTNSTHSLREWNFRGRKLSWNRGRERVNEKERKREKKATLPTKTAPKSLWSLSPFKSWANV